MQEDETQDPNATPPEDAPAEEPAAPETPEAPAPDEQPAPPTEAPSEDAPDPEEQAAPPDEAPTEEPVASADEPPAASADEPPAADESDQPAEELPAADPAPAEEVPAEESDPAAANEGDEDDSEEAAPEPQARKKDEAPGANLEPIRLEDDRELSAEERARLEAEQEEQARVEAAQAEDGVDEPALREGAKLNLPSGARIQATGKRKTSVARVVLVKGGGTIQVNRRTIEEYFPRSLHQTVARQALVTSGYESQVDVTVRVHGGGISGQADAVRHGIARALIEIDPELRGELKRRGMLTRDAREKERRKAGLKKARKRPQFSKR